IEHNNKNKKNEIKEKKAPHTKGIAMINIPYRDGMVAYVDHKKVKPKKVNYMMTGVPVTKQDSEIIIKYRPKYWFTMIIISVISILISIFGCLKKESKLNYRSLSEMRYDRVS